MWSAAIATQLRRLGYDVVAATELPRRYRGVPDDVVFERAREDGRAIVTDNIPDFSRLVADAAGRGDDHEGVIFALRPAFDRASPRIVGEMVNALDALARSDTQLRSGAVFLRRA